MSEPRDTLDSAAARMAASEALRLVQVAPRSALQAAEQAISTARTERDLAAESVAERALGLAHTYVGDLDEALPHLRRAVTLGRRAHAAVHVAEARMSLAFALGRRGRLRSAVREIEAALADLDGVARARALVQRAVIHHQLGQADEALAGYRRALPMLRQAGDLEWVQRTLANRAIEHVFRHSYAAAEADLQEAAQICEQLGLGLSAGIVQENLAFVHVRRGDVPAALQHFDEAERHYRALGAQTGALLTDRSELLLSVGLVYEARLAAEQAVAELTRDHRRIALPEAQLLLARAAVLDGEPRLALDQARRAVRSFTRQHRGAWAALARLQLLTARLAEGSRPVRTAEAVVVADALDTAGWSAPAVEARLLAGRLAVERGQLDAARVQLTAVSRRRRRGPAVMRAHAWHGEALLRLAEDDRRGAVSAVSAGLRVLDEHQASLGAIDLRVSAAGRRTQLTGLALRIALSDGSPGRVLYWAERGRAQRMLFSLNPPADPVLARALAELRATVAEIEQAHRAGRRAGKLLSQQAALERLIRDHCRKRPGPGAGTGTAQVIGPERLTEALGRATLVEYLEVDGVLHAVTLAGGRPRLHELGPASRARGLADTLSLTLHRLAWTRPGQDGRVPWARLRQAAAELDEAVLRPLAGVLGDRPLVLVPSGALQSVPWSALPYCTGRPVTLAPSATLWHAAAVPALPGPDLPGPDLPGTDLPGTDLPGTDLRGPALPGTHPGSERDPARTGTGPVLAAAGPGLPGAHVEVDLVANIYGAESVRLAGTAATVEAVGEALRGARVAHLATHGQIRGDNPLFSSLRLADGPLTVYDLERLAAAPHTVVLAACDAGRSVVRAGDQPLGLSAAFLGLGTRQLIAAVVPIPDGAAVPVMADFHRLLASGVSAAEALAAAQRGQAETPVGSQAVAVSFVCMGAGHPVPKLADPPASAGHPSQSGGTAPPAQ